MNTKKTEFLYALLGISAILIMSNSPIYFIDHLVNDDSMLYATYSQGQIRTWAAKFHLLAPYVEWPIMKLMVETSPGIARFASVIVYLLPSALCLYTLYRRIWGLMPMASFYAAVVPFIIPFQLALHIGINNGYPYPTMLAASLAMLTGGLFAVNTHFKGFYLFLSTTLIIFIALSAPNAPFVMAAVSSLFLCLMVTGHKRTLPLLIVSFFAISWTIWHQLDMPRLESTPFSLKESLYRLEIFITYFSMPFPSSLKGAQIFDVNISIALASILTLLIAISTVKPNKLIMEVPAHYQKHGTAVYNILFLLFCLSWVFFTALPYLTIAPQPYQERYYWLSGFGIAAIIPYAMQAIPNIKLLRIIRLHSTVLLIAILGIACTNFHVLRVEMVKYNEISAAIRHNLSIKERYPRRSQVIYISDHCTPHPGVSYSNTGFIWHLLGNKDIVFSHIYPPSFEYYWYNPLKIEEQDWWRPQLSGLKLSQPIFLYKDVDKEFRQLPMFLQVEDNGAGLDIWKLYKLDLESGASELFKVGKGEEEYLSYLVERYGRIDSKDIEKDIAFGVPSNAVKSDTKPQERYACGL